MATISEQHDDKFKEHVNKWVNMVPNTDEADAYYDQHILPHVTEIFIDHNKPKKEYDGLILTVGGSPEPLILSICAIKPNRVGLLYTENRKDSLERIYNKTNLTIVNMIEGAKKVDGSKTAEIYQAIMNFYTEWGKPENIAVGVTGGKKSMVSGAAIAGAVLGADIYYVDTDKKNKLNKPEPGSEYLRLLDNPYTVFGDLEVQKAKDLYDRHDYAGAGRIFQQLEQQVATPNQTKVYEAYRLLCKTYEAWDNFDMEEAKKSLEELLQIFEQYSPLTELAPLHEFKEAFEAQNEALEHLSYIFQKDNEQLAFCSSRGFHFAFMLYYNAKRRKKQGKYDIACLILYRLLEWIEQYRLAQRGICTSKPDYSKSGMDGTCLLNQYQKTWEKAQKTASKSTPPPRGLPDRIALVDGFLILEVLKDDIVNNNSTWHWGKVLGQIDTRNNSILVHGMKKVDEKGFKQFKSTVKQQFEKAQELAAIDVCTFNKQHEFIAPLP